MTRHTLTAVLTALAALIAVTGCKTSEANYRAAYEKAVAQRDNSTELDSTIYGRHRRSLTTREAVVDGDTIQYKSQHVRVTEQGGGIRENLRRYSVVVGQFKTLFNAKSMRERLVDAGYPATFVVETAEPYYYVVLSSHDNLQQAADALEKVRADRKFPISMREPLPFVLQAAR